MVKFVITMSPLSRLNSDGWRFTFFSAMLDDTITEWWISNCGEVWVRVGPKVPSRSKVIPVNHSIGRNVFPVNVFKILSLIYQKLTNFTHSKDMMEELKYTFAWFEVNYKVIGDVIIQYECIWMTLFSRYSSYLSKLWKCAIFPTICAQLRINRIRISLQNYDP